MIFIGKCKHRYEHSSAAFKVPIATYFTLFRRRHRQAWHRRRRVSKYPRIACAMPATIVNRLTQVANARPLPIAARYLIYDCCSTCRGAARIALGSTMTDAAASISGVGWPARFSSLLVPTSMRWPIFIGQHVARHSCNGQPSHFGVGEDTSSAAIGRSLISSRRGLAVELLHRRRAINGIDRGIEAARWRVAAGDDRP